MAIELISTITTKNNGGYAIVLSNEIKGGIHSKSTYEDMLKISNDRLQEGMLCYVIYEKKYYQWTGEKWSAFTINGGSNISGSNETSMYRVETYDEMLLIPTIDLKEGTLCHVKNDVNNMHLYYYNNSIWNGIGTKYQVWIGSTQPPNPNYLWVDTSNFFDENATIDVLATGNSMDVVTELVCSTKTTYTEENGQWKFSSTIKNCPETAIIMVALYSDDRMVGLSEITDISNVVSKDLYVDKCAFDKAKVFVWETLGTLRPLTTVEEIAYE